MTCRALRRARRVLIVTGSDAETFRREFSVVGVSWTSSRPSAPVRAQVRIRHRHAPAEASVSPSAEGGAAVVFDLAQRAVTPGQAVVFYDGTRVLGGGWIA